MLRRGTRSPERNIPMKKSRFTLYRVVVIGLMAAMVFVCTMFLGIRIPTPTGITQLKTANAICLLTGLLFGGWTGGPQLEATGAFRTARHGGRWTLVDPEGRLFFSIGSQNIESHRVSVDIICIQLHFHLTAVKGFLIFIHNYYSV